MPFKETCPMEERIGLFRDYETGVFSVSDLCRRYGISRETFYVWKRRRESGDDHWFEELSHAVAWCPHAQHEVRRVGTSGAIKWRGELVFLGEALVGELVGLAEHESDRHIVRFGGRDLGTIDRARRFLRFAPP